MNRAEFMRQLEGLLWDISPAERESALQYYNDYFDDAGMDKEQDVIETLGTPDSVAQSIRKDLLGNGYGDVVKKNAVSVRQGSYTGSSSEEYTNAAGYGQKKRSKMSPGTIAVIVILCIFASPILFSVAAGVFGVIGGSLICGGFGMLFLILTVAMAGIATPAAVRGMGFLIKKLLRKEETV